MAKWATSLFLILTLGASVLAGMPLHSAEQECGMSGMSGMDCCTTALGHGSETEIATARLCCAIDCTQSGTTGPSGFKKPRTASVLDTAPHPVAVQQPLPKVAVGYEFRRQHGPPGHSSPSYILNLSLLI